MFASQDIRAISGDPAQNKYTDALSSVERKYTELAQAYINYDNNGLNIRLGRQVIDTPLADSDDIWMTPNTFEAYMASYELGDAGLTFTVGNLQRWQGADASTSSTHPTNPDTAYANVINNSWSETGDDGTWLGSLQFENETLALSAWYYDISKSQTINVANKSTYVDGAYTFTIAEGKSFTLGAQYLTQSESDASGVDGSISGVIAEVALDSLVFGGAYNKAKVGNGKSLFEGFGGGASYTNMHNLTAGTFHDGSTGGGSSYVLGAEYTPNDFSFIAAYGTFKADNLSTTATGKQHATELDLGVNYAYNDGKIEASLFYIIGEDKESAAKTDYDDDYVQLTLNYNF
jgi:hypothetical protein